MKRHEALIPLTHDHHHALAQVRQLRLAAKGTDQERRSRSALFLSFFRDDTIKHFREEEEIVFPLLIEAAEAREPLARAMLEHLRIHSLVRTLEREVEQGDPTPDIMVRVAECLESHIRFEEKSLFPLIESTAGEAGLDSVTLSPRDRAPV